MPRMRTVRPLVARLAVLARRHPPLLYATSLFGWIVLLGLQAPQPALLCLSPSSFASAAAGGLEAMLTVNPLWLLVLSWLVMLLAMMPPLLAQPLAQLQDIEPDGRRVRATAMFAVGYGAIWLAAGAALAAMAMTLGAGAGAMAWPAFAIALLIALAWQATLFKQFCLNRCHRRPRLSAACLHADALRYGVTHGLWCVGACWALMLLPLLAGSAHLAVMAAVTVALLVERARPARPARWGLALPAFAKPGMMRSSA